MQHANGRSALSIVIERDPVVQLGHWDFAADRGQGKHASQVPVNRWHEVIGEPTTS
jgi:hypothetical protein